jgi:uncharacterized membrane protein YedE/YeeE
MALLGFAFLEPRFRRSRADLGTGLSLGAIITVGWILSAPSGAAEIGEAASVNFVLVFLIPGGASASSPSAIAFALPLLAGTLAGASLTSIAAGRFRIALPRDGRDARQNLAGAALMGIGGGLIGGCTIGHGLSGLAVLAPVSLVVLPVMALGARWALAYLETGRLFGLAPAAH